MYWEILCCAASIIGLKQRKLAFVPCTSGTGKDWPNYITWLNKLGEASDMNDRSLRRLLLIASPIFDQF